MNRYQKLIALAIKKAEPVDTILCKEMNVIVPSYRRKRKEWKAVLKCRGCNSIDEISGLIKFVGKLSKRISNTN